MTTLLVATDGSDLAIQAAVAGTSLTKQADKVLVVCAVDLVVPYEDATGHAGSTVTYEQAEAVNQESKTQSRAAVDATAKALRDAGYAPEPVETLVVEGDAGAMICRVAADVGASAVIIGSRGRGGLKRAFLGSVSDYVVRNAPCSVVVSRSQES
jgi:nucleotide-binding universal stress UspA family protein